MKCPQCAHRVPSKDLFLSSRYDPAICSHCGANVWFIPWRYYVVYSFALLFPVAMGQAIGAKHFLPGLGLSRSQVISTILLVWMGITALLIATVLKLQITKPSGSIQILGLTPPVTQTKKTALK